MSQTDSTLVSAHDVADELRRRLPKAGTLKIHKFLYYVQGWHLVWAGKPAFDERIEAWAKGPVVGSLWADEKYSRGRPDPDQLSPTQLETVGYVVDRYGRLTGEELIRLTHDEDPWRQATERDEPWTEANPEITHDALRTWFERDPERVAHVAEVERLRKSSASSFGPFDLTSDLEASITAAIDTATRGEPQIRETRPL